MPKALHASYRESPKVLAVCVLLSIAALFFYIWKTEQLSDFFADPWSKDSVARRDPRIVILEIQRDFDDSKRDTVEILKQRYGEQNQDILTLKYTVDAIKKLAQMHAAAVGIDYTLPLSTAPNRLLEQLVSRYPTVVFSVKVATAKSHPEKPDWEYHILGEQPAFIKGKNEGTSEICPFQSQRVRALPFFNMIKPDIPPPFPVRLYEMYGQKNGSPQYLPYIEKRYLLPIRFRTPQGSETDPINLFPYRKLEDFLSGQVPEKYFENKIVLLGFVGRYPDSEPRITPVGKNVPIAIVHAEALKMLLDGAYVKKLPALLLWLLIPLLGMLAGVISTRFSRSALFLLIGALLFLALTYQLGKFLYIRWNFFLDLSGIYLSVFSSILFVSSYKFYMSEYERRQIRSAFTHYLGQELLNEFLASRNLLAPQGSKKKVTILFVDIRNFTAFSAEKEPEEVLSQLREFFSAVASKVMEFEGYINKFLGDGFMAVFGVAEDEGHALQAVASAYAMLIALEKQNKIWEENKKQKLDIGIGINSGEVIWGNVGLPGKMEFTVTGDTVNTASRIQDLTKQYLNYPVLLSQSTKELLKDHDLSFHIDSLGEVQMRGKTLAAKLYGISSSSLHG